jgi:hypothetical protein
MPGEFSESEILTRHFPTFKRELNRWRRIVRWRGEGWAFELLKQMESEWAQEVAQGDDDSKRRARMLRHRADFRRIIARGHPAAIKLYLSACRPEMVPLAVWLWGRCADRFRLYGLSAFCHDPSPEVRRHVAKALRRLEAWALLREMAEAYPDDEKICWFATAPTTHRPFVERLKDYASSVDDSHADEVATPSRMPFWSLERMWERTPPKSVLAIRRMLRRIQHWVRWGMN